MSLNQNPFSVYDFLGYLIPGILFCSGLYLVNQNPCCISISLLSSITEIENYLLLFLVCYLIGHLLSFLSSVIIEKYSVWTLGYPSRYLFKKKKIRFWKSITDKYDKKHKIGSILRIISRFAIKTLISIIILPVTVHDLFIRHVLRLLDQYSRPFDEGLMIIVKNCSNQLLTTKYPKVVLNGSRNDDQDYFRVVYHYAIENAPNHVNKMQNYVALYGFIRTTTLIFVVLFWNSLIRYIWCGNISTYFWIPIVLSVISFVLYIDFNKFFRKFSVEAFMAAISSFSYCKQEQQGKKK